jgi:hypothetical protein
VSRGHSPAEPWSFYQRNGGTPPAVYDNTDRAHDALTLVHDAVHANLVGVSLAELPERLGALLGQVAADAMIDRSTEAGEITEPWEIERLIAQLADAVRARHYG